MGARVRAFSTIALALLCSWKALAEPRADLVLYVYDSFMSEGGLGPVVLPAFEKKCGCKVKALPSGDGGQLLSRLSLDAERGKALADAVVGLDQSTATRAAAFIEPWKKWKPKGWKNLAHDAVSESPEGFVPFDYGVLAFMADRQALKELGLEAPGSLSELLEPRWRRKFILEDPRTSTPGLAFALYAQAIWKEGFASNAAKLASQWLALAPGWDQAYGLFLKKEAPLVWSYTTSQAYHAEHGDTAHRYQAVIFLEGQPLQVEMAALVRGADSKRRELAQGFLEFLISEDVQKEIPKRNWMLPAREKVKLPESFRNLPRARSVVHLPKDAPVVKSAIDVWGRAVSGGR